MANVKETVNLLHKNWVNIIAELGDLNVESQKLNRRRQLLMSQFRRTT
jgi:hypothetical protein